MATSNPTIAFDMTSDATFRAWGLAISTALQAVGLVKTTDTGQIDFTTVLKPTVAATSAGYEIYRLNDGLQATRPVFMKIEYGSGVGSATTQCGIWVTYGTSTNGAGTLTGAVVSTRKNLWGTSGVTAQPCYFASDGSYLTMLLAPNQYNVAANTFFAFVAFDRTRDVANAITGDGFHYYSTYPGTSTIVSTFNAVPTSTSAINANSYTHFGWGILSFKVNAKVENGDTSGASNSAFSSAAFFQIPLSVGSAGYAGDVTYFPEVITSPALSYGSLLLAGYTTDLPASLTTLTVPVLGGTRTYIVVALDLTSLGTGIIRTLVRYE